MHISERGKTRAIAAALAVAITAAAGYSYSAITTAAPIHELSERPLPVIVIDAGHGGFDGGAVGVDEITEKDINLSIAKKLHDICVINGFDAVLTRQTDTALDGGEKTIRQQKNTDLHNRLAIAEGYQDSILISIHQNKFTVPKYFGAQVFYGPKNPESERLAEIMQRRMIAMLQPENTRQYKPCGSSVYLINSATMPSLLIECGFLSNPSDVYKLIDSEYQKQIAFTIFTGLAEYMGLGITPPAATG